MSIKKERVMKDGVDGGFIEISTEAQSSASISRNASGGYSYTVKIYQDDPEKREKEIDDTVKWIEGLIAKKRQENSEGL